MEQDPIQSDVRRKRRRRRRKKFMICFRCGISTTDFVVIDALRSPIEWHHVVGKVHHRRLRVPLCRPCHDFLTERYRDLGASMSSGMHLLERVASILLALAAFLPVLGEACVKWAEALRDLAKALDHAYPDWRNMKEAQ